VAFATCPEQIGRWRMAQQSLSVKNGKNGIVLDRFFLTREREKENIIISQSDLKT